MPKRARGKPPSQRANRHAAPSDPTSVRHAAYQKAGHAVAEALFERRELSGDEVRAIVAANPPKPLGVSQSD